MGQTGDPIWPGKETGWVISQSIFSSLEKNLWFGLSIFFWTQIGLLGLGLGLILLLGVAFIPTKPDPNPLSTTRPT